VAKEARSSYRAFAARETVVDAVDADLTELTAKMFAGPKGAKKARAIDSASSEGSIEIEDDLEESVEIVDEDDVVELESKQQEVESVSPTLDGGDEDQDVDDEELELLDKLDDEDLDPVALAADRPASPSIPADWWREDDGSGSSSGISESEIIQLGPKVPFVLEVIAHAARRDEKVLIFSNSLVTLDFLETVLRSEWYKFLRSNSAVGSSADPGSDPNKQFRFWRPGTQFLRLDGAVGGDTRQQHVDSFNSTNSKASVFLISTRAGNMGISLVGANRVIIFDTSWNPANDLQALFRCYRYGQKKPVFVYRLLAYNSMEEKIYKRQVVKSAMAARIVDKIEPDRVFTEKEHAELFQFEEEVATRQEISDVLEKSPRDPVLTAVANIVADSVLSIRDHEPLLEDKPEEKLTEEEQNAAEEDYQTEIQPPPPPPPAPVVPLFEHAPAAPASPAIPELPGLPSWGALDPFVAHAFSTALRNPNSLFALPVHTLEQMWNSLNPEFLQSLGFRPSNPDGR
jgi:transcriptional regulator ATRX